MIAAGLRISGSVESDGVIHIEGEVDGDVRCRHVTIGHDGRVNGNLSARSVEVLGKTSGSIQAEKVVIASTADVSGEVTHHTLVVESGARLDGFYRTTDKVDLSGTVDFRARIGPSLRKTIPAARRILPPRREPAGPQTVSPPAVSADTKALH